MNNLADISVFESLQNSANERMVSPMSVFNGGGTSYPGTFFSVDDSVVSVHNDAVAGGQGTGVKGNATQTTRNAYATVNRVVAMMHLTDILKRNTQNQAALSQLDQLQAIGKQLIDPIKIGRFANTMSKTLTSVLSMYDNQTGPAFDLNKIERYRGNAVHGMSWFDSIINPAKEQLKAIIAERQRNGSWSVDGQKNGQTGYAIDAQKGRNANATVQSKAVRRAAQQGSQRQVQQRQVQPQRQTQPQAQQRNQDKGMQSWWKKAGNAVTRGAKAFGRGVKDAWDVGAQYA